MALQYNRLSDSLTQRITDDRQNGNAPRLFCPDEAVLRRHDSDRDKSNVLRTAFIHDIDKILHCPYYNRYADKTQVFSFYKNDDLTRRALHVQLVSRIARTIGKALNLNADLIEAIALGHDIGHTPFGHAGESYLDELYYTHAGLHFSHNIHSVRVLDGIYPYNISLQTLSGIASHDGELEQEEYRPMPLTDFDEFDRQIAACYEDKKNVRRLTPSTLEGCVVRISDIIAYLGKDRQDAERAGLIRHEDFAGGAIGTYNAEIINNMMVSIIENSYGKPYIKMDAEIFTALKTAKRDNYKQIYEQPAVREKLESSVKPMMAALYEALREDLVNKRTDSPIFTHHIAYVKEAHYKRDIPYEQNDPDRIVVDYIASMTDDYMVDLYHHRIPDGTLEVSYEGYFDGHAKSEA